MKDEGRGPRTVDHFSWTDRWVWLSLHLDKDCCPILLPFCKYYVGKHKSIDKEPGRLIIEWTLRNWKLRHSYYLCLTCKDQFFPSSLSQVHISGLCYNTDNSSKDCESKYRRKKRHDFFLRFCVYLLESSFCFTILLHKTFWVCYVFFRVINCPIQPQPDGPWFRSRWGTDTQEMVDTGLLRHGVEGQSFSPVVILKSDTTRWHFSNYVSFTNPAMDRVSFVRYYNRKW